MLPFLSREYVPADSPLSQTHGGANIFLSDTHSAFSPDRLPSHTGQNPDLQTVLWLPENLRKYTGLPEGHRTYAAL